MMLGELLNAFIIGIDCVYVIDFGNGNNLAIKTYLCPRSLSIAAPVGSATSSAPDFQIHCASSIEALVSKSPILNMCLLVKIAWAFPVSQD
jgi:hypothetical protein